MIKKEPRKAEIQVTSEKSTFDDLMNYLLIIPFAIGFIVFSVGSLVISIVFPPLGVVLIIVYSMIAYLIYRRTRK